MRTSPDFSKNPMGTYVDPDKMTAPRKAGASPWNCTNEPVPASLRSCSPTTESAALEAARHGDAYAVTTDARALAERLRLFECNFSNLLSYIFR
jgi:hypothetical protein